MKDVRPCPYCGGEVEVVRVKDKETLVTKGNKKEKVTEKQYRIECKRCKALVAKGTKFPNESKHDGESRIRDYEAVIEKQFNKIGCDVWTQTMAAKRRDYEAQYSSRKDPENEYED